MRDRFYLIDQRQTAAELLALAALDLFPGTQLFTGQGTETLFFYDFVFKQPLQKSQLSILEERIRFLLKKNLKIQMKEMVRANAVSFLKHHKQGLLAKKIAAEEGALVSMVQIGSHLSPCHRVCGDWDSEKKIKLLESYSFESEGLCVTRVIGVFGDEKERFKNFSFAEHHHLVLNAKEQWFVPLSLGWGWLPKGERLRKILLEKWGSLAEKRGFQSVKTPCQDRDPTYLEAHLACLEPGSSVCELVYSEGVEEGEGLLGTPIYQTDFFHILPLEKNIHLSCLSCLQFILEIPRILNFEFEIVLYTGGQRASKERFEVLSSLLRESELRYSVEKNPQFGQDACIVLYIRDGLGRKWSSSWMRLVSVKRGLFRGAVVIEGSILGRIERLIALVLELRKELKL